MGAYMSKTSFSYPVDRLCGKISRHSKIIHSCTSSGMQITYLQGERDLTAHPESPAELAARNLFARRQATVAARVDHKAETYAADIAAYQAARLAATTPEQKESTKTFTRYIWSLVKAEITE